ncbi:putative nuclease of predicted toxin-antitoxin system [Nonlabens dokdonensis]|jgi:predicted nuclease of predicted toxin-antitoxin system|uniref:DUF5615 domain-containing protein n=2 Tax=Nonlabens dokdonensis TaxID=328515 RepID=L7W8I0_NONDD|nr:DUF5615 family PIN-like protein [Nonlabens dokdonensis]AGC76527.1 hypothetical protein DDD_1400 [Nonlabens dokdonensis DSW-6]PZX44178.1 putative nuclease of predicted toxin-antitoxin system [Nonlabens dokdonensis]
MKLLLDQNISFRVIPSIIEYFPESQQVKYLNLQNATDHEIWEFAQLHGFTIVTFDADFYNISQIKGFPPKIIWLRTGNLTSNAITTLLMKHKVVINDFINHDDFNKIACLEINE